MSDQTYCTIGKLKLVPIEGAKTLQLGYYGGLPYAVSKSLGPDDLVAIFLPDSQLSEEYFEANKDDLAFFGKNRKVRSIKLMQGKITSVGYVASLSSLAFTGYDIHNLNDGDSFNELNGIPICKKFVNPNTLRAQSLRTLSKKKKLSVVGLPEHPDTQQFYKFANKLEPGDLITITLKLDGTSVRVANAYTTKELKWYEKLIDKFVPIQKVDNRLYTGTRRVVIEETTGTGYYGTHDMYLDIGRKLDGLLFPGEAIYGEIVGWQDENRPLFTRGGVRFIYGTKPGERDFYVYNIKWTLPNGQSVDLSWSKIKQRCLELGLKHVPEMMANYNINVKDGWWHFGDTYEIEEQILPHFIYDGDIERLQEIIYSFTDGPDPIDPSHIREGVVLRVEKASTGEVQFFKAKSQAFYELEDKSKEAGDVDIEESQEISDADSN